MQGKRPTDELCAGVVPVLLACAQMVKVTEGPMFYNNTTTKPYLNIRKVGRIIVQHL